MPNVTDYLKYAETAFAAYASDLKIGTGNITKYVAGDMSPTQAQHFDATWAVLAQQDLLNGFSAILLQPLDAQGNPSGQKVLAIRGSQEPMDWATDIVNIALLGSTIGMPQYASLENFYQSLIANHKLEATESIITTGHSLGGFLAQAFASQHSTVSAAYTYNSPGFSAGVLLANSTTELLKLFGLSGTIPNQKVFNARALDGIAATAGLGQMTGSVQTFNIEGSADPISNHSIKTLTDALAVYDLFTRADSSLSPQNIGNILKASSASSANTLEAATKALSKIFTGSEPAIPVDSRDALYQAIYGLQSNSTFKALAGSANIESLSTSSLATQSQSGPNALAYRYALKAGNPFVLLGAPTLYDKFNPNGELDLYDKATGQGELTEEWLADRAQFLAWLIKANTDDKTAISDGGEQWAIEDKTLKGATEFLPYSLDINSGLLGTSSEPLRALSGMLRSTGKSGQKRNLSGPLFIGGGR